jgi:hypothetical protein
VVVALSAKRFERQASAGGAESRGRSAGRASFVAHQASSWARGAGAAAVCHDVTAAART